MGRKLVQWVRHHTKVSSKFIQFLHSSSTDFPCIETPEGKCEVFGWSSSEGIEIN